MTNRFLLFIIFFAVIMGCVPPSQNDSTDNLSDVNSTTFQKIYDLVDQRKVDSLYRYLRKSDDWTKKMILMGFASLKDSTTIDSLVPYLKESNIDVRTMAAYALGQIGNPRAQNALVSAFVSKDTLDADNKYNATILESLGKLADASVLKNIASVTTYRSSDTTLLVGQMRAIYRFGLRNITSAEGTKLAIKYLSDTAYPNQVRLIAAHYLARTKGFSLATEASALMSLFELEKDPEIKSALASAFSKTTDVAIAKRLIQQLSTETDNRVKCNILRVLPNFAYDTIAPTLLKFVEDKNIAVGQCAAEAIAKNSNPKELYLYRELISDSLSWQVRSAMYKTLMTATPLFFTNVKNDVAAEIGRRIRNTENAYERAALISALGKDPYQYYTLLQLSPLMSKPVEKTAIIDALGDILNNKELTRAYGAKWVDVKVAILNYLVGKVREGDPGNVAAAASIMSNPDAQCKGWIRDSSWMDTGLGKLSPKKDLEAIIALEECKAYMLGNKFVKPKASYNHPINWKTLLDVKEGSVAIVKTTKGNIKFKLFLKESPATVINFVELAKSGFYKDKVFHRVVPNFVIQSGCPRGDGYGSLDYTIRSEFGQQYYDKEGYVGMASAGPDTEGTQFFITHSATPHLDGNYTIFAKVMEGMDVVHNITIGDKIIDIIVAKEDLK